MTTNDEIIALETELMSLIHRSRVNARDMAREVDPRLEPTAYPLVVTLAYGEPQRVSELAMALYLDKSTVSRQIDGLARLGLVERLPDPDDARARLVTLTTEGKNIISEQQERRHERTREVLHRWRDGDVRELTRLLRQALETGLF